MYFHEIGGYITEIYQTCENETEWKTLVDNDPKLSKLKEKWDTFNLLEFPFSDEDVNYLNSPLIDGLKQVVKSMTNVIPKKLWGISCFTSACKFGNIEVVKFIMKYYLKPEHNEYLYRGFKQTCENNHLEVSKYLYYLIDKSEIKDDDINHSLFIGVSKTGSIDVAKWLVQVVSMTNRTYFFAFDKACEYGQLEFAKWLYTHCPPDSQTTLSAFRGACFKGHLDVAKWLYELYKYINPYFQDCRIFRKVCSNGDLELAKWLKETWADLNVRTIDDEAFRLACQNGHFEVAKWLLEICPEINPSGRNYFALVHACKNGHVKIAKWLVDMCNRK